MSNDVDKYDVIIIGAGIAGLVCGNYLAKAGLKTLLLEQHYAAGGCCSSFNRGGFVFDSGAHSLGSCRPGGQFDRVLRDLDLFGKIDVRRSEPSDTVITRNLQIDFAGNAEEMANGLAQHFPKERRAVADFFKELDSFDINLTRSFIAYYSKYKSSTFREMLDSHFYDERLKIVLCAFLGNLGLASTRIAALPAIAMFKEFVLDGGYYVLGGMQVFVNSLAENFQRLGGELCLRTEVTKIITHHLQTRGVETRNASLIESRFIISTTGIKQTFFRLIEADILPSRVVVKLRSLVPSVSSMIVYLGIKGSPVNSAGFGRTVWYMPNGNPDEVYERVFAGGLDEGAELLLMAFPSHYDETLAPKNCESVYLFTVAPFKDGEFWKKHKAALCDQMVSRASDLIRDLRKRIVVCEVATPMTLYRYTLNDEGAVYGLASTLDQFKPRVMPQETVIGGLYLASHWTTVGAGQGGTPMAAFAGRNAARLVLERLNKRARGTSAVVSLYPKTH